MNNSTHVTNYGSYGNTLRVFSDTRGYLPTSHRVSQDDFEYDGVFTDEDWVDHVVHCVEALEDADKAVAAWRE